MTIPNGAAAINPQIKFPVSNNISQLAGRTQGAVVTQLRDEKYPTSVPPGWDGRKVKAGQIESLDASKVNTGQFADSQVPSVGALRDAICQAIYGGGVTGYTAAQVKTAIQSLVDRIEELENP